VFFLIRALSLELRSTPETELPLTKPENLVKNNDKLDLSTKKKQNFSSKKKKSCFYFKDNSDLIACTVHMVDK